EFTWGPSSDWTKIRPRNCIRRAAHGYSAETSHQTRPETNPDALVAAGDQAAADVDARTVGPAQSGDGREPDARRGSDRGSSASRSSDHPGKTRPRAATKQDRHLGRPGLRILFRRLP